MMITTQDDILKLSLHNPVVRSCVMFWQRGDCTWEQAMMSAVVLLAEQNKALQDNLAQCLEMQPVTHKTLRDLFSP